MHEPKPVIPEETLDLPAILRLPAAEFELKSSSLMLLAAMKTENRRVVICSPMDALQIPNYRTFSPNEMVDVNTAAALLRDDMPDITGSRKTVWPSLCTCAAMADWMRRFVMDHADIQRTCADKNSAIRSWGGAGGANIKNLATPLAPQTQRSTEYRCTA